MTISDFLLLSLLALGAVGCAGEWGRAAEGVLLDKICLPQIRACYLGAPFTLLEYVSQLHAPGAVLAWPVFQLFSALLILFKPRRAYLGLLVLSFATFGLLLTSAPVPYVEYQSGTGQQLAMLSMFALALFSMPLALAEQITLHPNQKSFWNSIFH